jgi:L-lactate dehydrogenase complex protein LldF
MMTTELQDFKSRAAEMADPARAGLRGIIAKAIRTYDEAVARGKRQFTDWQAARAEAASIKWDAVNHLDRYLEQFEANVIKNGGQVFWAETAEEARQYILELARRNRVTKVVKSKSMTTEEIHLNEALERAGIEAVETDLGEFIVQLRNEPPYHIVTPAMHLTRGQISELFHEKGLMQREESGSRDFKSLPHRRGGDAAPTAEGGSRDYKSLPQEVAATSAEELTMAARARLRGDFLSATMGITGANFAVAETGQISITENEGNARLTFGLPKIHVAVVGIEKILPRFEDLALFLPLLATSGTGQKITCYNSFISGPRLDGETDGPEEFHVVLLDNGRTELLADVEQRDALHCIRCGACLNACPIFKNVGGHTYGTTYQGPIGSVITPHLRGLKDWGHLPYASSLCGACTDVCPVKVDLHHHLLHNRRSVVERRSVGASERGMNGKSSTVHSPRSTLHESASSRRQLRGIGDWSEKAAFSFYAWIMESALRYETMAKIGRVGQRVFGATGLEGSAADPLRAWTRSRAFPQVAKQSFREWWEEEREEGRRRKEEGGAQAVEVAAPMKKTTLKINVPPEVAGEAAGGEPKVMLNKATLKIKVPTEEKEEGGGKKEEGAA